MNSQKMEMTRLIMILFIMMGLHSCIVQPEKCESDERIHYDDTVIFYGDALNDSLSALVKKQIIEKDSLVIRLLGFFENDCVQIYQNDSLIKKLDSISTNLSVFITATVIIKNTKGVKGMLTIKDCTSEGTDSFCYKKGYLYLDVIKQDSVYEFRFNNSANLYY